VEASAVSLHKHSGRNDTLRARSEKKIDAAKLSNRTPTAALVGRFMLRFERSNQGGRGRDVLCLPTATAPEAQDALREGGFSPSEEQGDETDDEEGNIGTPPSVVSTDGGGHIASRTVPMKLWSLDQDTGNGVGFLCSNDMRKSVLYAKLALRGMTTGERFLKRAITSLFDVAEACTSRRITIGLSSDHAGNPDFVCSLLYLGFQVAPPRRSPLANIALLLDFDIGWPTGGLSSDQNLTATSDCSTSAVETATEQEITAADSDW